MRQVSRLVMRDLVFINWHTGEPAKNSSYDTHLYKLCDEAGIEKFCMHALRHTYATRAIESGVQPKVLQKLLGHASIKTTMDRYVHVTNDSMSKAVLQFEKVQQNQNGTVSAVQAPKTLEKKEIEKTMKLGIVGLPNVGKSTLFNAITNAGAESANYPFCTIEPNVGVVAVPDERLDKLAEMYQPDKKTPAVIEFVDIAGLVKGASQGAGLGNKFLENIRRTDAIVHVVRCFDDENIMHVVADAGTNVPVDPLGDIETIDMELILADLEMVNRRVEKAAKAAKGDKKFLHEAEVFKALAEHLDAGKSARTFSCGDDDRALVETCDLLSLKPIIYAANMDEAGFADYENNRYFRLVRDLAQKESAQVLPICAKLEQDIAELDDPEERAMFLEDLGIEKSGLDRLIQCSYDLLGLISFLTYGKDECRAWTIRKGTKAPQAAGKIHSDIERGFIRAETINFDEMMACGGSVAAAKEKGLLRSEGKDYVVKDGDMIYFRFNV